MIRCFTRAATLLCAVAVVLSALSLKTTGAKAATSSWQVSQNQFSSSSCRKWSVVPSANGSANSGLSGVATVSDNDVWAVGGSGSQSSGGQTLIEHWDGTQWQIVASPNPGTSYNVLYGVTAISSSDVWAVGYYVNANQVAETLIEQWNGTQWNVVKSPSPASVDNELLSVAAVSTSDVWAVGFSATNTSEQTLIEHWNGTKWSVVKNPSPGSNDALSGVAAVSANDVWAVGASNTMSQSLIEQWNGSSWSVVKNPSPGSGSALRDVAEVSATDLWAVGYTTTNSAIQTYIEHWNGTKWQVVKGDNVGTHPSFTGVAAVSANDVWAVGSNGNGNVFARTLIEQWNGTKWSVVKSPSPGSFSTQLQGVAAVSANDVWTVGGADGNTLIERYHC